MWGEGLHVGRPWSGLLRGWQWMGGNDDLRLSHFFENLGACRPIVVVLIREFNLDSITLEPLGVE